MPKKTSTTVTRVELADAVHRNAGTSRTESAYFVELVLNEMMDAIVTEGILRLSSFGNFTVKAKEGRVGRNPKTGAEAPITPRRVLVFKASAIVKAKLAAQGV
jgi:integration host factor subunit alpha